MTMMVHDNHDDDDDDDDDDDQRVATPQSLVQNEQELI